jgi:hypothetical protein
VIGTGDMHGPGAATPAGPAAPARLPTPAGLVVPGGAVVPSSCGMLVPPPLNVYMSIKIATQLVKLYYYQKCARNLYTPLEPEVLTVETLL